MPKPIKNTKPTLRGEFSTVIDLETLRAASKDNKLPDEIPVLPKGEFMTLPYGNMVLDDHVFEQMIGNFKAKVRRGVPVDFDHAWENTKAAGWIKELVNKADGLWAKVDWNKLGVEAVAEKIYRMISAEWSFDYVDPQKSTHHGAVLVAATLTNRPLMQSMPTITASEKDLTNDTGIMILLNESSNSDKNNMPTITEILAKKPEDRTEEELAFLEENKDDFTEEQAEQVQKEAEAAEGEGESTEGAEGEGAEGSEGEAEGEGAEGEEGEEDKEASNKDVTIKASELERYKKMEADHKAAEALKAAEDFANPFLKASEGKVKVLPKAKDALIELTQTLSEKQRGLLASVLKATGDNEVAGSEGEDDTAGLTATEEYNKLVAEYMEKGMSASEANKKVRKEHKKVYAAFTAENK